MDTSVPNRHGTWPSRGAGPGFLKLITCLAFASAVVLLSVAPASAYVPGKQAWVQQYGVQGGQADAHSVAAGPGGTACVVGSVKVPGSAAHDMTVIAFRPSGARKWLATYDGPAHGDDLGLYAAFDTYGNVYVTGQSDTSVGNSDVVIIKYSPRGKRLWVRRYGGSALLEDQPNGMAVDEAGNVYVTGSSQVTDRLSGSPRRSTTQGDTGNGSLASTRARATPRRDQATHPALPSTQRGTRMSPVRRRTAT